VRVAHYSRWLGSAPLASSRRAIAAVLFAASISLTAGFILKLCPVSESRNLSLLCYSDLKLFFETRGIAEMPFPYIHGGLRGNQMIPGFIEYPVLTGIFAWATARPAWSPRSYVAVSAAFLGIFGLLAAYLLARMAQWRALLYAAAPAIVLYAFHNWDLLAVAATVSGLWCWWRQRPLWAAALFAVGACAKMYPAIFIGPLVFEALFTRAWRAAVLRAIAGAGTVVLINLPFLLVNPQGWLATYQFHGSRPPNIDSIWGLRFAWNFGATSWAVDTLNLLTAALMLTSFAVVFAEGWRRANRDARYPFLQVCGAALSVFLLWNKVHSPQYTLWILPFLVLLDTHVWWWLAYMVVDGLVYVTVFYVGRISLDLAAPFLQIGVFGRGALLAMLTVVFLRAPAVVGQPVVGVDAESQ
jgi:uncharacterized membrane protein